MISALSLDSMSYTWFVILSCSIFVPAVIGGVRILKVDSAFHPFIICLWIGAINELISIYFSQSGNSTHVNNNIYVIIEAILLIWQLKRWGAFDRFHRLYFMLILIFISGWLLENYFLASIHATEPWFRLGYSFIIVLLAIQVVNHLIISERRSLIRNPIFLVTMGCIIYFTYKGLVEVFWINGFNTSPGFLINVYSIMIWINLLVNIIFSFAVLWMPEKLRFTMTY